MAVKRQHVISQAILRRWTVDGDLAAIDLRTGNVKPKSTRATGFVPWFVQADYSTSIEAVWKEVEDQIPGLISSVEDGTATESPSNVDGLRRLVAVHLIRSKTVAKLWGQALDRQNAGGRLSAIREALDTPTVARAVYQQETGLIVVGEVPADRLTGRFRRRLEGAAGPGGEWFVENALLLQAQVLDLLQIKSIQIGRDHGRRLILGDSPATTYNPSLDRVGVLDGASLPASTILMPITPEYVVSFGEQSGYIELSDQEVDRMNNIQYTTSSDWIYAVPGSEQLLSLQSVVRSNLSHQPHRRR